MSAPDAAARDASRDGFASILAGTDARARGAYGAPASFERPLAKLGSCTANPPGREQARIAAMLEAAGAPLDAYRRLASLLGADLVLPCASGTDAEYLATLAMGERSLFSLEIDPREVGSGCALAAAGLPHALGGPVAAPLDLDIQLETLPLRSALGAALSLSEIDQSFLELASMAGARPALLRICPCSKTGLRGPSEEAMARALLDNPRARCVVDASQGRFSAEDFARWMGQGWGVILTGSKSWGAPPFCGALVFGSQGLALWPAAAAATLPQPPHPGLALRWSMALAVISGAGGSWHAPPSELDAWRGAILRFLTTLRQHPGLVRSHELSQGIASFDFGLTLAAARSLHKDLIGQGFFLGQPVDIGAGRSMLRIAWGVGMDLEALDADLARLAHILPRMAFSRRPLMEDS